MRLTFTLLQPAHSLVAACVAPVCCERDRDAASETRSDPLQTLSAGEMDAYAAARQASKHMSIKLHLAVKLVCRQCVRDNKKVVVASHFVQFLEILACRLEALGISFVSFTGAVRGAVRSAQLAQWKAPHSNIDVLLMTTQCGNAGISLDPDLHPDGRPRTTLVLDVDSMSELNPATRAQLLMRWNRRMNDPHQDTLVVSLVVPGTMDEISEYLAAKQRGTARVLGKRKAAPKPQPNEEDEEY